MSITNRLVFGVLTSLTVLFVAFFVVVADASAADRYWIGTSVSDSWSSTSFWSTTSGGAGGASVPGSGDNAIFDANSSSATMPAGDMILNGLDIQATYPGGNTVTLTTGTLKATDAFRHAAGTMDTNGGTVQFGDNEGNQFQLNSDATLNNFVFNKASGWQVDMNGFTLTVNGDTTRTSGTFDEAGTVVFKGDVTVDNTDIFNATTTIEFAAGTTQTFTNNGLTAGDSFRGPFLVNTADTIVELAANDLDFHTAGVLTVSNGTFDMNNVSITGLNNILIDGGTLTQGTGTLEATTSTNAFRITSGTYNGGGTGTLDLNASQATETAIDGGTFNAPAVLQIARDFNVSTTATFNHMNGLVQSGTNGGSYEIEGGAGTIRLFDFTLNMSGWTASIDAATTFVVEGTFTWTAGGFSDGSSATNPFQLEGNADIDVADTSGTAEMYITGTGTQTLDFATVGAWDTNIIVNKTGGAVSLLTGLTLDQASNDTLTIEEGTFDINGQALTVGTFSVEDGGNFQMAGTESPTTPTLASGSTVTYDATTGTNAIKDYGYHHLTFNGSGGTFTMHAGGETVAGNLTITAGTFDLDGNNLTVSGTFSNDDIIQLEGGETTVSLTMDTDSGTASYKGDGITSYTGLKLGNAYNNLKFNNAGNSWTLNAALDVDGNLDITAGVLDTGANNVNVAGNWTVVGVYQAGSNTTTFDGTSGTQTVITGGTGVNFDFNDVVINNSGTEVQLSTNDIDIDGNLTLTGGTFDASGQSVTVAGTFANNATLQLDGNETLTLTMDTDSGTTDFAGSGTYASGIPKDNFFNLSFSGSGSWTLNAPLDANGTYTQSAGTVNAGGNQMTIAGNYAKTGGTFTSAGNTVVFDGTSGTQTINTGGTGTGDDFDNVQFGNSGTAAQLITNAMDVDGTFTNTGTFDLNGQGLTVVSTVSNTDTILLEGGESVTLTAGMDIDSGTVEYDGTGTYASGLAAGDTYFILTFDGSGGSWTMDAALNVDDNLTITNGTLITGGNNINLAGAWTNNGTFTHGSALVTLDGTNQGMAGSTTFYNLTKSVTSAASLTMVAGDTFTVANDLTLNGASGQVLSLLSNSAGTAFNMSVAGTPTVSYLSVKDANNTGSSILCVTGCSNVSGNTGWIFASTATPSSVIYEDNDSDGAIDRIISRFASNVGLTGTVASTRFTFVSSSGANGFGGSLSGNASVSGTDVIVTISSAEVGETGHSTAPTLAYDDNSDDSTNYITDVNGDMIQTFTATTATDGAAPQFASAKYQDTNADGAVDTVEVTLTEAVSTNAATIGDFTYVANDLTSSSLTSGTNNAETAAAFTLTLGTNGPSGTTSHSTAPTLAYTFSSGALQDSAGNQAANFTAQNLADGAAPIITDFNYKDTDADGKVDQVVATFSETVTAATTLAPNDLTFSNVGDFTGMLFGSSTTDAVTGSVTTATLALGTEATAIDTVEGSGNIAVTSQNAFSLTDGTNTNTTLGAQASATFTDGAAPIITDFNYKDTDADGKVDQVVATFSETVTAATTLAPNDLTFSNVGDFTGMLFGSSTTDAVTGSVTTATLALGTEATAVDTAENSGNIAVTSQNAFSLTDGTNTNTTLSAQTSATFTDSASPLLVSSDPANDDQNVSRSDDITLTFSEPITTASFAYTCCGTGTDPGTRATTWSSSDTVATISHAQFQSSEDITIDVTAAPDASSNSFGGAIAATGSDPYTFKTQSAGGVTVGVNDDNIAGGSTINPTLTLASPNGGEKYAPGDKVSIGWTQKGRVDMVNILFSPDNGSTWETIQSAVRNLGYITWTVPSTITNAAKILIQGTDNATTFGEDRSNEAFTIEAPESTTPEPEEDEPEVEDIPVEPDGTVDTDEITELLPIGTPVVKVETPKNPGIDLAVGDVFRGVTDPAVYVLRSDGSRAFFPNSDVFNSYFNDFDNVLTINDDQLRKLPLGKRVTMRPGTWLVKIQSDPKVYAVERDGVLRHVPDEGTAQFLYGQDWNQQIRDVNVAFFSDYSIGAPLPTNTYLPEGTVFKYEESPQLFIIQNRIRRLFLDAEAFVLNNFQERFIRDVPLIFEFDEGTPIEDLDPELLKDLVGG